MYPVWFEYAAIIAVSVRADHRLAAVPAWRDLVANAAVVAGDYALQYDEYLSVLFEEVKHSTDGEDGQEVDRWFERGALLDAGCR